jgi:hypothetical protein
MAIQELPVFPQVTFTEANGLTGTRKWVLDHDDDLDMFLRMVSHSHLPDWHDAIPVQIQHGPFFEGGVIQRPSGKQKRTYETLGAFPQYGKVLVVVQYALHRMTNCWPKHLCYDSPDSSQKPWHPVGTTLELSAKSGTQFLLISPTGLKQGLTPLTGCVDSDTPVRALSQAVQARVVVPITEYNLRCDRLTPYQLDQAFNPSWDTYQGCVNRWFFLGARPGTLLFDGYTLAENIICDQSQPLRYTLTACFKHRVIRGAKGPKIVDGWPVGWNHDFINLGGTRGWGWKLIQMRNSDSGDGGTPNSGCELRYKMRSFSAIFGSNAEQACDANTEDTTTFDDDALCPDNSGDFDPPWLDGSSSSSSSGSSSGSSTGYDWGWVSGEPT